MLRLTGLVTGTCDECVSVAKKASLHDWVLRSNVSQAAIKLLRDSACTGCPFHLLGVLVTTFVQVCSLVSYSNLTLIYYYLDVSLASIYCGE